MGGGFPLHVWLNTSGHMGEGSPLHVWLNTPGHMGEGSPLHVWLKQGLTWHVKGVSGHSHNYML